MNDTLRVRCLLVFCILVFSTTLYSQNEYRYKIDLNKAENDTLTVELLVPKLQKDVVTFCFPKIIPGTYAISDYGKFVSHVKAFDKAGKQLIVSKQSTDKWKITNAEALRRVIYNITDIFDTK